MHPLDHSKITAVRWGGKAEDYVKIHSWFDESKAHFGDIRHRALRHHAEGIFMLERIFGVSITNSAGKEVPVRYIGEQHVRDDLGFIPTIADWFSNIKLQGWMQRGPFARTNMVVKKSRIDLNEQDH